MTRKAATVVAAWAGGNAALTIMLVIYGGPTLALRSITFASASFLVLLAAVAVLVFRRNHEPPTPSRVETSGGPALGLAGACFVGAMAWVFGVYLAYLALPLLAYAVGKWLAEARGETEAETEAG